jgi:uncharacterized membrane protein YjfL (UPF0719 family)
MPELTLIRASLISQALHLFYAVVALVVGTVAIRLVDKIFLKRIDLEEEIARGNLAPAVLAGAIWVALAMILTRAS